MKTKLSVTGVKTIPLPEQGETFYWCNELAGFGVKATPTTKSYIVQARAGKGGRVVRHYIGRCTEIPFPQAKNKAMRALATIRDGMDLNVERVTRAKRHKAQSLTLAQLFDDYVSKRSLRPNTKRTYEDALRLCIPDWCNKPVTSITRDMIEKRLQSISDEPGVRGNRKAQAVQCFTLLRALFRFAADRYEVDGVPLIQSTPTRNVARGKSWAKIEARDNIIAESDLQEWYQATEAIETSVLRDYIQFLMFSGMRRTEAITLKWSDIDSKLKVINVRAEIAKSGRKRQVPITPLLQRVLERRRASRDGAADKVVDIHKINPFIFEGGKPGTHLVEPRRAAQLVREKTDIQFCFHDLRRTYIAHASRFIPYPAVKTLAGHSTSSSNDVTLRHYAKLDLESLKVEALKVSEWFAQKCSIGVEQEAQLKV